MILESIYYSQHDGTPQEWKLEECTLGLINLIVGENAAGKSKLLNIVGNLGNVLSGSKGAFRSANYRAQFNKDGDDVKYVLKCEGNSVTNEELSINSNTLLTRGADGLGTIYFKQLDNMVDFQAPSSQVVSFARRDAIQHPFLEDMYEWGRSIRHYYFGSLLGKDQIVVPLKSREGQPELELDPRNTNTVVAMFIDAQKRFAGQFTNPIMQDMEAIGYKLKEIGTAPPFSLAIEGAPGEVVVIYAREADLDGITDQNEMSQGMFRALSLLVQITYSQLIKKPACILIDDIGEGLDYNRSTALVKLLVDKAKETPFQLIMATNDRFVMNSVPLEYWSVVRRIGNMSRVYSQRNSPNLFKEFELTGLNNFDFFSSNYYLKDGPQN